MYDHALWVCSVTHNHMSLASYVWSQNRKLTRSPTPCRSLWSFCLRIFPLAHVNTPSYAIMYTPSWLVPPAFPHLAQYFSYRKTAPAGYFTADPSWSERRWKAHGKWQRKAKRFIFDFSVDSLHDLKCNDFLLNIEINSKEELHTDTALKTTGPMEDRKTLVIGECEFQLNTVSFI